MRKLSAFLTLVLIVTACGKDAGSTRRKSGGGNDDGGSNGDFAKVTPVIIEYFEGPLTNPNGNGSIEFNKNTSSISYTFSSNVGSQTNNNFPLGTFCKIKYTGKFAIQGVSTEERNILGAQNTLKPELKLVYTVSQLEETNGASAACEKYVTYTNESITAGGLVMTKTSYIKKFDNKIVDLTNDIYFLK